MIERDRDVGVIRQVGRDVVGAELDLPVLHVLRVDEEDVVEDAEVLQQGRADEAVEVGTGDQAVALGFG